VPLSLTQHPQSSRTPDLLPKATMGDETKRKRTDDLSGRSAKKKTGKNRQWRKQSNASGHANTPATKATIDSGDAGVFVTFGKGQDGKCIAEAKDLFSQYADKLYGDRLDHAPSDEEAHDGVDGDDIEAQIRREIKGLKPGTRKTLFYSVRLEIPCVAFIKVAAPVDPVKLVHEVCADAQHDPEQKRSRWIQRMAPMTLMRKTMGQGLEELTEKVLKPHFHSGGPSRKYAIRPTIRAHNTWTRDSVIKLVADAVGDRHSVDLKNYNLLILVDIYRNVCGMSVVGSDYDQLKRFNLAEIYSPTPLPAPKKDPEPDGEGGVKPRAVELQPPPG